MAKEKKAQVKVKVGIESLWRTMTKDLALVVPKIAPTVVESMEVIEGDGGLGSLFLLHLCIGASKKLQKEKIVELDESTYRFGIQVVEGPALTRGSFSTLTSTFQVSAVGEKESLVDVNVVYQTDRQDQAIIEEMAIQPPLNFILGLEKFLLQLSE
ncbi:hypothetical protein FEM48_Zijuj01G0204700 [Ziziphus jujuba var. spinosa]|uniref:Bet v I/Major latex protein domain-containing protein n=1 Tax=Ziziphus jujuba var. spinosa TaxID=714518 RepID=A0A978W3E0_ZIZJJ|nr:hypothetical protein FEM48_Zijuj01G0204700 [Ziziphus jujuba var. spinosa]